ncbi:AbrB family transcriptional regulator [Bacillus sp. NPDC093026]|uniref:AbrB family transcriptional regulator n=1 Tax=Bacillus sp. NPDC093026 TaxID=3363948 RepID=UPI00380F1CED
MKQGNSLQTDLIFIVISGLGGFLLSLTGMSIGWMIGTLVTAAFIALFRPFRFQRKEKISPIHGNWLILGQFILGVELGQKMNMKVLHIFAENWLSVSFMLIFSIFLAMLSGFVMWKLSKTDMLTSFVGTAPGGLSAMPGIAQEVGANTAVVSLVQTIRVLMVVLTIPFTVFYLNTKSHSDAVVTTHGSAFSSGVFTVSNLTWTAALIFAAWLVSRMAVRLHFPAPWLIGSMLGVATLQVAAGAFIEHDLIPYWPAQANVASQLCLGATIGSKMNKQMFVGLKNTFIVAVISSAGLIAATVLSSIAIAEITGISVITAILAFSPGGIAEMATTAVTLHEDSTFVVAVQVIRVILVIAMLPPFFRFLHHFWVKRQMNYKAAK